jgi:WS/DGAT/MGAT family acyltransferase
MKETEPLSGVDAAWLRMDDPTNLMVITSVLVLEDPVEVAAVRDLVRERLLGFTRFRQRVREVGGSPHWEIDPHFDLRHHVRRAALPGEKDRAELQERVSELMATPLDPAKPLWDFEVVENYRSGSAIIIRIHHCIADGIALVHVLLSLTDEHFDASRFPNTEEDDSRLPHLLRAPVRAVRNTVHAGERLLSESIASVLRPRHALHRAKQGMSLGAALSKFALLPEDSAPLLQGDLRVRKQAAWSDPIGLPAVKRVGRPVDAKVNDVLLGAVAGALRHYFQTHDVDTEGVSVRALIPVNLRSQEQAFELGNRFGLVYLDLPIHQRRRLERVLTVKRQMDEIKGSSEAVAALGILEALGYAPLPLEDRAVRLFSSKASAVMTNVPGPRRKLHIDGHRIEYIMPWVPRAGNIGLGVSIFSYAGTVRVGIASDAGLVPDPETILHGFQNEFDGLVDDLSDDLSDDASSSPPSMEGADGARGSAPP